MQPGSPQPDVSQPAVDASARRANRAANATHRRRRRVAALAATALASALALAACSGAADAAKPGERGDGGGAAPQTVTVFAAASLQGPLDTIAEDFAAKHPEYRVAPIVYDGSQALATQAIDGADVDVLAFASQASLEPVQKAGLTDAGTVFATNVLQIATAPGNPKKLASLADLAKDGVSTVICAPEVPCGQATVKVEKDAGVTLKPVSEETSVTAVLRRVESGEADAGLVYTTDVKAAGDKVQGVALPNAGVAVNTYPAAVSSKARSPQAGKAFEEYLLSEEGQAVLREAGFGAP